MKNYNPKLDLWTKIQQQKDFDAQVKMHAANLPERMPKADLWSNIESELDRKTPVIPLWKYGMAAASIALILALSGIAYLQFGEKEVEQQVVSEVSRSGPELTDVDENKVSEEMSDLGITQRNEPIILKSKKLPISREKTIPIEIEKLDLTELSIENTFIQELKISLAPVQEAPKTLHQVSISWSRIKPRLQVKTQFGQQELVQSTQAAVDPIGQVSIKINN